MIITQMSNTPVVDKSTVDHLKKLRIGISDFEVKNVIGRGHFGEVQVVREKSTSDVYALKVLRKADTLAQQNVRISFRWLIKSYS